LGGGEGEGGGRGGARANYKDRQSGGDIDKYWFTESGETKGGKI